MVKEEQDIYQDDISDIIFYQWLSIHPFDRFLPFIWDEVTGAAAPSREAQTPSPLANLTIRVILTPLPRGHLTRCQVHPYWLYFSDWSNGCTLSRHSPVSPDPRSGTRWEGLVSHVWLNENWIYYNLYIMEVFGTPLSGPSTMTCLPWVAHQGH